MVKVKKSKKGIADAVYAKKTVTQKSNPFANATAATSKKLNPFEVHVNKEKFQILGRICKHDKGLPGVSRGKAIKKRKETLGQEYRDKHKTNRFKDRRIGKHLTDEQLTDDVINARFAAEQVAQVKQNKNSKFNLNDDEVLTHRGQTLEEIEQFRDDRSDDDTEDEALNAEFTEAAHFGGDEKVTADRKAAIEDMIMEQKKRKIDIMKEKEEVHSLTQKLDTNYKELIGVMGKSTKKEANTKAAPDDYDKIMREMIFEPRGVVSDKLLSEEEFAKKEKERLEKLERERLKRMEPDDEVEKEDMKPKHRSADDLDDGYYAYSNQVEEEQTLTYNLEGELETKITDEVQKENNSDNSVEEKDPTADKSGVGIADEDENSEEDDDESENDEEDNISDLKYSDSDSEIEEDKEEQQTTTAKKPKQKLQENEELPFTIDMPVSYEEFEDLLRKRSSKEQGIIIERLIKCNHPKLDGINRENIVKLFAFLLQHINELFSDATEIDVRASFGILKELEKHMFELVHLSPEKISKTFSKVLKEKHLKYRKRPKEYPTLETLVFFDLVSKLYSTSDFRHPIVTPCFVFMQHILSKGQVRTRQDIATGLFLVTLVLQYTLRSKRYLPAAFNFLLGVIYLCIPKRQIEVFKIVPPFKSTGPFSKLLAIGESVDDKFPIEELLKCEDFVLTTISTDFKVRALNNTLKLIKDTITNIKDNVGANYLAAPFLPMLKRLPLDLYPTYVRKNYEDVSAILNEVSNKSLNKIVPPTKKPKALRLLEPRFEAVYDDKRRPKLSAEKEERAKLLHKVKRETKGAIREIRRDTEFLQKIKIRQQIQSDQERREKVKRIYQEASVQQGELNQLAYEKKKKKH